MELEDRVAVITGGASGIGLGTAAALAKRGVDVVLADIHETRLGEARERIAATGREVLTVSCDVTSDRDVEALGAQAIAWKGHVDILMNNAGFAVMGPPERTSMDNWRAILDVNLLGIVRGVRALLPHMLDRGSGHVVNTASVAGLYAYSYDAGPYITSKFAAVGYTESLAVYARAFGLGVSVLCPGLVDTHLGETARLSGVDDPAAWMHFPEHMQRAISPDEVGELVCEAIRENRYLILTHPEDAAVIAKRREDYDAAIREQVARAPVPPRSG